jgi:hypothetical protein
MCQLYEGSSNSQPSGRIYPMDGASLALKRGGVLHVWGEWGWGGNLGFIVGCDKSFLNCPLAVWQCYARSPNKDKENGTWK